MARIFYKSHKSQAALEFLTTYAWAFIVITITIGTLYYFGAFDFALRPGEVRAKLINNLGEDIQVNTVQITNDANPPISCISPVVPFSWPRATEKELVFSSCSGGAYAPDSRVDLKITLVYFAVNTPSQPIHVVNGKINGRVTSS